MSSRGSESSFYDPADLKCPACNGMGKQKVNFHLPKPENLTRHEAQCWPIQEKVWVVCWLCEGAKYLEPESEGDHV